MKLICGVDPGTKTGWALFDIHTRRLVRVETTGIITAMSELMPIINAELIILIRFEDARQRKWYGKRGDFNHQGVGSIKRDCNIWQEFCEYKKIKYDAVKPQSGQTKWSSDRFKKVTGWGKRTSEHARDAALLVYGWR